MNTIQMQSFLAGKCLPGDMRVNETNAEYLVRKFAEKDEQVRQLTEQRDAVVAECQSKKSALEAILEHCPVNHPHIDAACAAMIAYDNLHCVETPATSAILDSLKTEARADAFSYAADSVRHEITCLKERSPTLKEMACLAIEFDLMARQLRESKGANHGN